MKSRAEQVMYEVVHPLGEETAEAGHLAPRLDTLNGKTICEAWNGLFRGERTFPKIRELLEKRYTGIKTIPYTELPSLGVVGIEEALKVLPDVLREKGCDALIAGNGG